MPVASWVIIIRNFYGDLNEIPVCPYFSVLIFIKSNSVYWQSWGYKKRHVITLNSHIADNGNALSEIEGVGFFKFCATLNTNHASTWDRTHCVPSSPFFRGVELPFGQRTIDNNCLILLEFMIEETQTLSARNSFPIDMSRHSMVILYMWKNIYS